MRAYERFLKYVAFPTMSNEESGTHPSSDKQLVLARELKKELEELTLKEEEERSNAVFQVGDYVYVTNFNSYGTITKKNKDI